MDLCAERRLVLLRYSRHIYFARARVMMAALFFASSVNLWRSALPRTGERAVLVRPVGTLLCCKRTTRDSSAVSVYSPSIWRGYSKAFLTASAGMNTWEIRGLVGMNDFERSLRSLMLPPLLFEYVWQANEMLVDVAPPAEQKPRGLELLWHACLTKSTTFQCNFHADHWMQ